MTKNLPPFWTRVAVLVLSFAVVWAAAWLAVRGPDSSGRNHAEELAVFVGLDEASKYRWQCQSNSRGVTVTYNNRVDYEAAVTDLRARLEVPDSH